MDNAPFAVGIGIGTRNERGQWLEVLYPGPLLRPKGNFADFYKLLGYARSGAGGNRAIEVQPEAVLPLCDALQKTGKDGARAARAAVPLTVLAVKEIDAQPLVVTVLDRDAAPASVPEAYLKLHLLSHRLAKPHELCLDGLFAALPTVAWTSEGAVDLDELPLRQVSARLGGRVLTVNSVDKFPPMTDYVVPPGVRIADTARVRLGAYLGKGTTVMHEGFVNFNAGTEGPGMIEGRISAGVMVGANSDVGGGASIMGTLSGGGDMVISIGKNCLLGANSGVGIPLGDRCAVEAGLYVTAGTRVAVLNGKGAATGTVKARELAGRSNLLFRRHSESGRVECLPNKTKAALNKTLHAHN